MDMDVAPPFPPRLSPLLLMLFYVWQSGRRIPPPLFSGDTGRLIPPAAWEEDLYLLITSHS